MNEKKNGGPAFPVHGTMGEIVQEGMTLRDYFAAKAMQGILASGDMDLTIPDKEVAEARAKLAFLHADAMMETSDA